MIADRTLQRRIRQAFPFLAHAEPGFGEAFMAGASVHRAPAGHLVCGEGQACDALAMVLAGSVRVHKIGASGREITLYRIASGDSCVLTASCILSDARFPALAVTESNVEAVFIPAPEVRKWLDLSGAWRGFVFGLVARRMTDVITVIESVAFHRVDERLAAYLLRLSSGGAARLALTHQEVAYELGTSREVISRILKELEHAGVVRIGRGVIEVIDASGLHGLMGG